jgi:hypothetical protein
MARISSSVVDPVASMLEARGEVVHLPRHQEGDAEPGSGSVLARAAVIIPLAAFAFVLILFSLVPAVFVALILLLPALLPVILLGLGILATAGVKTPEETRQCPPGQPCCCGRHLEGMPT